MESSSPYNSFEDFENFGGNAGEAMKPVIKLSNKLYKIIESIQLEGYLTSLSLPQIVVCGSQSSGKTSVLENITGESFLPRGTNIQTRCPIILQLLHNKYGEKWVNIQGRGEQFRDMSVVQNILKEHNNRIIEDGLIITKTPITLTLNSPHVVDLTLVDLPGLIENEIRGQPEGLVKEINSLVAEYINKENTIILAITSASTDIANSTSLRLARQADPEKKRTIGVVTKLDLMDKGTNASDVLTGKSYELNLGIFGVVNKSHLDNQNGISVQEVWEKEKNFLEENYTEIAHCHGTPYLTLKISELLAERIIQTLPNISKTVDEKMQELKLQLEQLNEVPEVENVREEMNNLILKFTYAYMAQVDGSKRKLRTDVLHAAVEINQIFDEKLRSGLNANSAESRIDDNCILMAIQNSKGMHNTTQILDDAVQELAKREVKRLKGVVQDCNKKVYEALKKAVTTSFHSRIIDRYPNLVRQIQKVSMELLHEKFKESTKYLNDYIKAEASLVRSSIDERLEAKRKQESEQKPGSSKFVYEDELLEDYRKTLSLKGNMDVNFGLDNPGQIAAEVRRQVEQYQRKIRRLILEHVPKGIANKLVYRVSKEIGKCLVSNFDNIDQQEIEDMMTPHDDKKEERAKLQYMINRHEEALEQVNEIFRDTYTNRFA